MVLVSAVTGTHTHKKKDYQVTQMVIVSLVRVGTPLIGCGVSAALLFHQSYAGFLCVCVFWCVFFFLYLCV